MQQSRQLYSSLHRQNWIIPVIYLLLVLIGITSQYSVSLDHEKLSEGLYIPRGFIKELIPIGIGVTLYFAVRLVPPHTWQHTHMILYAMGIVLLLAVLLFGREVHGSKSWIILPGGMSLQVAEFAKITIALSLSAYLAHYKTKLDTLRYQAIAVSIIGVPAIFILLQPDAGSALIVLSLMFVLLFAGFPAILFVAAAVLATLFITLELFGLFAAIWLILLGFILFLFSTAERKKRYEVIAILLLGNIMGFVFFGVEELVIFHSLILIYQLTKEILKKSFQRTINVTVVLLVLIATTFSIDTAINQLLESHQRERIQTWLKPSEADPLGSTYNVIQSKTAIGSGGFSGQGLFQGNLTHLDFIPEQNTDFIFSVIGEEQGFLGTLAVLALFAILLLRLSNLALRQKNKFSRYFILSVCVLTFIHVVVNIGMTIGVLPVIGIPLPLISKGGSCFLVFSMMLGIADTMQFRRNDR